MGITWQNLEDAGNVMQRRQRRNAHMHIFPSAVSIFRMEPDELVVGESKKRRGEWCFQNVLSSHQLETRSNFQTKKKRGMQKSGKGKTKIVKACKKN